MANILNTFKEKLTNSFTTEETVVNPSMRHNVQPRANKGMVVGGSQIDDSEEITQNRIFDTSDDICVLRGMQLVEDGGNYIISAIKRLERGQLIVVDFSESDERNREIQFHALWGAAMAFHGSYKVLDKASNLVLFSSNNSRIGEERGMHGE